MKLIYFQIYGTDPLYTKMLRMCINSIRSFPENDDIDTMIICEKDTWPLISDVNFDLVLVIPTSQRPINLRGWDRLRLPSLADLSKYEKVMYLDNDIIVTGNLHPMFDAIDEPNVLHIAPVEDYEEHRTEWHSVSALPYSESELTTFREKELFPFCSGHFGFRPSEKLKYHFSECYDLHTKSWASGCHEQGVMNRYFNIRELTKPSLRPFVQLHGMFTNFDPEKAEKKLVNHFIGCNVSPESKIEHMKNFFKWHVFSVLPFAVGDAPNVHHFTQLENISCLKDEMNGWFMIPKDRSIEEIVDVLSSKCLRVWWMHSNGSQILIRI